MQYIHGLGRLCNALAPRNAIRRSATHCCGADGTT
jgi:hypothetical protein